MFFLLLVYMLNSNLAMLIWNCICRPATFVQLSLSDVSRCDVESQHHVGIDGKRRGRAYSPDCYGATVGEEPEERLWEKISIVMFPILRARAHEFAFMIFSGVPASQEAVRFVYPVE